MLVSSRERMSSVDWRLDVAVTSKGRRGVPACSAGGSGHARDGGCRSRRPRRSSDLWSVQLRDRPSAAMSTARSTAVSSCPLRTSRFVRFQATPCALAAPGACRDVQDRVHACMVCLSPSGHTSPLATTGADSARRLATMARRVRFDGGLARLDIASRTRNLPPRDPVGQPAIRCPPAADDRDAASQQSRRRRSATIVARAQAPETHLSPRLCDQRRIRRCRDRGRWFSGMLTA